MRAASAAVAGKILEHIPFDGLPGACSAKAQQDRVMSVRTMAHFASLPCGGVVVKVDPLGLRCWQSP